MSQKIAFGSEPDAIFIDGVSQSEQDDARFIGLERAFFVRVFRVVADELRALHVIEQRAGNFVLCPVAGNEQTLAIELAGVGVDMRIVFEQRAERAVDDDVVRVAEVDELFVIVENGSRIIDFVGRVDVAIIRIHRDPRRASCEAGVHAGIPLHRRAGVVPCHVVEAGEHGFGAYALLVDDELFCTAQ